MKPAARLLISAIALNLFGSTIAAEETHMLVTPRTLPADSKEHQYASCQRLFVYEMHYKPDSYVEKEFYRLVERFGGRGKYFIDFFKVVGKQECGRPNLSYASYLVKNPGEKPETEFNPMLYLLGTAIHETVHLYSENAHLFEKRKEKNNYIQKNIGLGQTAFLTTSLGYRNLYHSKTFPSKEIEKTIINKNVLENFRYRIYVSESDPELATQIFGIYGLLDEFHAYYYDVMSNNLVLKLLSTEERTIDNGDNTYFTLGNNDTYLSFLEFKLFILNYFRTAREHYPAIYSEMINNAALLDVIVQLHDEFSKQYQETLSYFLEDKLDDLYKDDREVLLNELNIDENKNMMKLIRNKRNQLI